MAAQVGSLNKIPLAVLGVWIFDARITAKGGMYITLSLLAGVLYAYTKARESRAAAALQRKSSALEPGAAKKGGADVELGGGSRTGNWTA